MRWASRARTWGHGLRAHRLAAAIAALTIAATGVVAAGSAPAPAATTQQSFAVRKIGVTFVDHSRRTPANAAAHVRASKSRIVVTTIWIPEGRGPFPLILFAHGNGSNPSQYKPTVEPWAEAGYVVAAPIFPISSRDGGSNAGVADIANQPGDLRFVLTRVLALSRAKGVLHGKVDPHHIGVAGHSLGAVTTLGYVERSCCRDPRIDAAISISGTPLIGGTDFKGTGPPLLLIHGDHDPTVNYAGSSSSYTRASPPKYFLTVLGGLHGDFLGGHRTPAVSVVARTTLDFWNAYLKGDAAALARLPTDSVADVTTMQATPGATPTTVTSATRVDPSALPSGEMVEVFMKVGATNAQIARVRRAIEHSPVVKAYGYVNHTGAMQEFRKIFRNDPDLTKHISANALPVSFKVVLEAGSSSTSFRHFIEQFAGVDASIAPEPLTASTPNCEPDNADLHIALDVAATPAEQAAAEQTIRTTPGVTSVRVIGREESARLLECVSATLKLGIGAVHAAQSPVAFRVQVAPGTDLQKLATQLVRIPAVDLVSHGDAILDPLAHR